MFFFSFFNHIFDTSYSNGVSVLFENQNEFTLIFNSFLWKSKIVPHLSDSNNLSPNFFLYTQSVSPRHAHTKSAIFSFVPLCSPLRCLLLRTTVFSSAQTLFAPLSSSWGVLLYVVSSLMQIEGHSLHRHLHVVFSSVVVLSSSSPYVLVLSSAMIGNPLSSISKLCSCSPSFFSESVHLWLWILGL